MVTLPFYSDVSQGGTSWYKVLDLIGKNTREQLHYFARTYKTWCIIMAVSTLMWSSPRTAKTKSYENILPHNYDCQLACKVGLKQLHLRQESSSVAKRTVTWNLTYYNSTFPSTLLTAAPKNKTLTKKLLQHVWCFVSVHPTHVLEHVMFRICASNSRTAAACPMFRICASDSRTWACPMFRICASDSRTGARLMFHICIQFTSFVSVHPTQALEHVRCSIYVYPTHVLKQVLCSIYVHPTHAFRICASDSSTGAHLMFRICASDSRTEVSLMFHICASNSRLSYLCIRLTY
jgi:hypothetical protein